MEALSAYAGKPGHASMMEANVMLALALCIVVLSLGFEFAKDRLQRATPKELHAMLDQMFSELTLLGFIGILLFFAEQSVAVADYSERVFGDPDTISDCAEEVHMTLFLVMLVYLGMVVCLVVVGNAHYAYHLVPGPRPTCGAVGGR